MSDMQQGTYFAETSAKLTSANPSSSKGNKNNEGIKIAMSFPL